MTNAMTELHSPADREYLDQRFRRHYPMLARLAASIIREPDSAEDVVISAMMSLFSLVPKLRAMTEDQEIAYLRATVRNAAYQHYNAHHRENGTGQIPLESILHSISGPENQTPEHILEDNEEFQLVRKAIATLPDQDRRLLYLKYSAQISTEEIAEMTNAPCETVRKRLYRARRKVLDQLRDWGWEHG